MIVVYIAGPFRGPDAYAVHLNCNKAEATAFAVWTSGMVALCPHNNTRHFDGALTDKVWLDGDLELLSRCDALLVSPGWDKSRGALAEIAFAEGKDIPIFYGMDQLLKYKRDRETL